MKWILLVILLTCAPANARVITFESGTHRVQVQFNDLVPEDYLRDFEHLQVEKVSDGRNMSAEEGVYLPDNEPAVAVTVLGKSGEFFLWAPPEGWYPSETQGVLLMRPTQEGHSRLQRYETKWWGLKIWLDRTEACSLAVASMAGAITLVRFAPVCPPCPLVGTVVGAQALWLGLNVGVYGSYIEVSWLGVMHRAEPIGDELSKDDDCYDANPSIPTSTVVHTQDLLIPGEKPLPAGCKKCVRP